MSSLWKWMKKVPWRRLGNIATDVAAKIPVTAPFAAVAKTVLDKTKSSTSKPQQLIQAPSVESRVVTTTWFY